MVLLPLVRTSACLPTPPRDSSSTDTLHSDNMSPFLSVSGAGLVLSNVSLILGTGPLLDFGLLSHDSTRSDEVVGGNDVTLSTSHLSGTVCLDINAFGSFGCVNTSFSHCSSNAEPSSTLHSFAHKHFSQGGDYKYTNTSQLTLTFHLCTFTNMTSANNRACVYVHAPHDVTMTECSFKDIGGRLSRAVTVEITTKGEASLTLSLCSFVNCTGTVFGAALYHQGNSLSIDKCFFKKITATDDSSCGGAVYVCHTTTPSITNSVFMDCSANLKSGLGGALCVEHHNLSMESVQFRGNSAPNGSDVYLDDGSEYPTEVKKDISDCHTDDYTTSVVFYHYGVKTGIIQQFKTATTITSLQLNMPANVVGGTIQVETQHPMKGKMLLLLDNTGAYNPISESSSPPAACRVVVVNFPTLSTTGASEVLSFGDKERLQFRSNYTLIAASIPAALIDITPLSIDISVDPSFVCSFKAEQTDKLGEVLVSLEGYKLSVGEYTIHFEGSPSLSLTVSFDDDQAGLENQTSSPVSVGPGGEHTQFSLGETYKVDNITFKGQPVMLGSLGFSLIVPPFPTPFVIKVDKTIADDEKCQDKESVCKSFDSAFETATKMRMKSIEMILMLSDTISKPFSISDDSEMVLKQGGLVRPSLIVPSTFSSSSLVVLSVSKSSLKLTDVDALIHSSSLDLKLVRVSSGSFEFRNGVIKYTPHLTTNSKIGNADTDLCSWTTGTIELVNSTAVLKSCNLTNLAQGAIMQSGGNVTLRDVYFKSNGPTNKEFPSARRNVMCSSDGTLFVGYLREDDGNHDLPGFGISSDGCEVSGTATTMSIVFLDTSESQITHNKKTRNFELDLVGRGFLLQKPLLLS